MPRTIKEGDYCAITLRYVCSQKLHVIRIDLRGVRPSLILEFMPGTIKFLHCLQKFILNS